MGDVPRGTYKGLVGEQTMKRPTPPLQSGEQHGGKSGRSHDGLLSSG
jgi:hypothetical protein